MSKLISVREANDIVLQQARRLPKQRVNLPDSLGRILASDIVSDIDMPPFNRSMMDGYALCWQDAQIAPAKLQVVGFVQAGTNPKFTIEPGQAAKIMTGAPLPRGADSVCQIEKTSAAGAGTVVEILEPVTKGQNVVMQAAEVTRGEVVMAAGTYVTPAVIGLLAATGNVQVDVFGMPEVAILATGDELVEPGVKPLQGQIRNSNSYALQALCHKIGLRTHLLGVAKDDKSGLRSKITHGLQHDVLLITGGVSVGDFDLVDAVLRDMHLQILFESVSIKPGKPTMLAKRENKLVFGLPGNPVSSATVFEVLVRPALKKMMGYPVYQDLHVHASLTQFFVNKSQRENFHPSVTWYEDGKFFCRPLATKGSGDLAGYSRCNSYLICPVDVNELHEGSLVNVVLRDDFYLT